MRRYALILYEVWLSHNRFFWFGWRICFISTHTHLYFGLNCISKIIWELIVSCIKLSIIFTQLFVQKRFVFWGFFSNSGILFWKGVAAGGSEGVRYGDSSSKSLVKLSFYSANIVIMATFFGEVLSVYSRAVEEDEEDLEENEEDEQIRRELEEKR